MDVIPIQLTCLSHDDSFDVYPILPTSGEGFATQQQLEKPYSRAAAFLNNRCCSISPDHGFGA